MQKVIIMYFRHRVVFYDHLSFVARIYGINLTLAVICLLQLPAIYGQNHRNQQVVVKHRLHCEVM